MEHLQKVWDMTLPTPLNPKSQILVDSEEKPFECKVCKLFFSQQTHLKSHQLTHSIEMLQLTNIGKTLTLALSVQSLFPYQVA